MKTELTTNYDKRLTLQTSGNMIKLDHVTEDGVVVHLELDANELLQAVKAHHALTKTNS